MSNLLRLEENIPALRRYAWVLLRDEDEADDLVQDCLVRALDRLGTRAGEGDIRPWLFAIMHNLCVSRWRRARIRSLFMAGHDAEWAVPPAQQATAELREVWAALDRLPPEQRQVMLLVVVEGFGYAEAATILGVPIGTVMSRLSRARDRLREASEGRERPALRRVK